MRPRCNKYDISVVGLSDWASHLHGDENPSLWGVRVSDNQSAVIKFLRNEYPTFSELLQSRNQYAIAKNLNISGIVRPDSLETYGNSYALVMADGGGISLREYYQTHSLELTEVLAIALQLAQILHEMHAERVIHKQGYFILNRFFKTSRP